MLDWRPVMDGQILEGKVAIVTGGAQGMGASHCEFLARAGARVMLVDILDEVGGQTAERLQGQGLQVDYRHLDVSRSGEWTAVVQDTAEQWSPATVLVNNAGIAGAPSYGVADCPDEDFDRVIDVNQKGVFYGMRAVIPGMREQGGGSIINIASSWSHTGGAPDAAVAYVASKWAVRGLTRNAALSLAKDGIRVNSVSPGGVIDTPMPNAPGVEEKELERCPMGRIAQPTEMSPAVVYLASDLSSFVTGIDILIDGGGETV